MYLYILLLHIIFWMSPDGPTVLNMFLKHFLQVMVLLPGSFRKLRRPLPATANFHNYFYFPVQAIAIMWQLSVTLSLATSSRIIKDYAGLDLTRSSLCATALLSSLKILAGRIVRAQVATKVKLFLIFILGYLRQQATSTIPGQLLKHLQLLSRDRLSVGSVMKMKEMVALSLPLLLALSLLFFYWSMTHLPSFLQSEDWIWLQPWDDRFQRREVL